MISVHRVPVLSDNYSFVVEHDGQAVVIDPPEVDPIADLLEEKGLKLVALWITHRHSDHTAGIGGLLERFGKVPVKASAEDRGHVPHQTEEVREGETFEFFDEQVEVLSVPGHVDGHIAYYLPKSGHVFSGDVVFGASCGKVFGGNFDQMFRSVSKIAALPDRTQIWCGHEYTLGNLKFAERVDPDNQRIKERLATESVPTVPLNVGVEKATNPFMRCDTEPVRRFTGKTEPAEVFAELRKLKDRG